MRHIRLSAALEDAVEEIATRENRSLNYVVNDLVSEALKDRDRARSAKVARNAGRDAMKGARK